MIPSRNDQLKYIDITVTVNVAIRMRAHRGANNLTPHTPAYTRKGILMQQKPH